MLIRSIPRIPLEDINFETPVYDVVDSDPPPQHSGGSVYISFRNFRPLIILCIHNLRMLTGKKHPQIRLQRLQKV